MKPQSMDILIEVRGGVVQNVVTLQGDIRFSVIDWDDIDTDPSVALSVGWSVGAKRDSLRPETAAILNRLTAK
jgi:hypothetical protein